MAKDIFSFLSFFVPYLYHTSCLKATYGYKSNSLPLSLSTLHSLSKFILFLSVEIYLAFPFTLLSNVTTASVCWELLYIISSVQWEST